MNASNRGLPLPANPSLAFPDTNIFGQLSKPFILKQNQIKPSTELAPDSLRYTNISGINPMTSITGAGPTSSGSGPLYSGTPVILSASKEKAKLKLDPITTAALSNNLINSPKELKK